MHVEAIGQCQMSSPIVLNIIFVTDLSQNWELANKLDWLTRALCCYTPKHAIPIIMWMLGIHRYSCF